MINFDTLPKDKPNQSNISDGKYTATIFDAKMMVSKTTNQKYLNVSFKLDTGGFVNENYFDSDKPFLLYKLGQLLLACNVKLEGEGSLEDIAKVIKGKTVVIDVAVNDRGYGALDYSGDKEGIAAADTNKAATTTDPATVELDADVNNAIEDTDLQVDPYENF